MATSNFSLPIGAQGVPPIGGNGGGFGQPSGVSINPPSGGYGGVAGTHPGNTFQNTVGPRNQVRFQVQPQVTVACRPAFPLPEGTRRKDYLMSVFLDRRESDYGNKTYLAMRANGFVGEVVMGLQQINEILAHLTTKKDTQISSFLEPAARYVESALDKTTSFDVVGVIQPFGVYNNRGTHNGQEAFAAIPNSNVGNIIGVNISNYCFMRDIWGVDLRCGDALELWYIQENYLDRDGNSHFLVQIHPVAGCVENADGTFDTRWLEQTYGKSGPIPDAAKNPFLLLHRARIGRVWSTPIHHPFQNASSIKNIVGYDAEAEDSNEPHLFKIGTKPSLVYKNIEVELSASRSIDFI